MAKRVSNCFYLIYMKLVAAIRIDQPAIRVSFIERHAEISSIRKGFEVSYRSGIPKVAVRGDFPAYGR